MRVIFLQLALTLCIIANTIANNAKAQESLQMIVTVNETNSTLGSLLQKLEKQYNINFVYSSSIINTNRSVTLTVIDEPLEQVLKNVLAPFKLTFQASGDVIVIKTAVTQHSVMDPVEKQQQVVTGKITDNKTGEPLPGVSVLVKGSSTGTTTNSQGVYSLKITDLKSVLVFSYLGYDTQEKPINGNAIINVTLIAKDNSLNEVVVIGYGTSKRGDLTGSVAQVKMRDFAKAPVKSFDDALAGRIAGLTVTGNDGQPGSLNNLVIRGAGSVTQDNSPLYVVDGFPLENANNNSINPADIESIDVLKDASATAIYGARGANGVIVITTKRGKRGDPVITYNGYYGSQQNPKIIPLMSPYEFVKYQLEVDPVIAPTIYLQNGNTLDSYANVQGLNLQKEMYRTAPMQNHDISIRGGTDKTRYSISGNIFDQDGIIINSGFKRYQGRITLDQTVKDNLRVGVNVNYSNSTAYGSIQSTPNISSSLNLLFAALAYRPVSGTGADLENLLYDPSIDPLQSADLRVNPVISAENEIKRTVVDNLAINSYLEYDFLKGLTLRVTGGISNNMTRNDTFNNSMTNAGNPRNTNGVNGSIYYNPNNSWLNENTLSYKNTFDKVHNISILGGFTMQGTNTATRGTYGANIVNESEGLDALDEAPTLAATYVSSRNTLASFLGRVNYDYKSKYLFTASFRADGSSKFAPQNRWGYFPSAAVAWRMSDESFIKSLKFISDAKLRLSYGLTGNNRVSDFPYLSQLSFPNSAAYSYNNATPAQGAILNTIGNPDLKWETTAQVDLGYDLSLFNNIIGLTVDVYRKTTDNLLLLANLPYTTGFASTYKNVGKMQNQGLEITLNSVNIHSKDFSWNSDFNISFNSNKVLALTENQTSLTSMVTWDNTWANNPAYIAAIGQSVGQIYGLIWNGNYQYSDFDVTPQGKYVLKSSVPTNGNPRANIQPGDIKYKDINGDGVVDAKDFTVIGSGLPVFTGGFSNDFTYKGFDLNIFFQWSYGNDLLNANRLIFDGNGKFKLNTNQYATYENRWTPANQNNTKYRTGGQGPAFYSSRVVEDGSYLKLKTVSLGYTVPIDYLKKVGIKSLRIYTSAQNLITWTNYSGPDPDVSSRNSTLTPGFDFAAYPHYRTITLGLNVTL